MYICWTPYHKIWEILRYPIDVHQEVKVGRLIEMFYFIYYSSDKGLTPELEEEEMYKLINCI